jgi:alpha-ketoglutaric semialdehyde dehydrogenase
MNPTLARPDVVSRHPCRLPALHSGSEAIEGADLSGTDHVSPRDRHAVLWRIPFCSAEQVSRGAKTARAVLDVWQCWPAERRADVLRAVAGRVQAEAERFALQIAVDTGKPLGDARLEVGFAVDLVREALRFACGTTGEGWRGAGWHLRRQPVGVVAIITPWNNPLAIPLGKLAPALLHGNTVVWKPAPAGAALALRILNLLLEAGLLPGTVNVAQGDRTTAMLLAADGNVDAVTLTGSSTAGQALHTVCAARRVPFQGELGGNNAAIVWADADLPAAASSLARAGFGAAGQRCTATRRVIVPYECFHHFRELFLEATARLRWGDPLDAATDVGPLISADALRRVGAVIDRTRSSGVAVFAPHTASSPGTDGFYYPPTVVCCDDDSMEVVQEETFGPVVVLQQARDWNRAVRLCNGVSQGLVAALFSRSRDVQERFLAEARAGMLKINMPTAGAVACAPFGGWKESGIGPFEHGVADAEFYSRYQTIYVSEPSALS